MARAEQLLGRSPVLSDLQPLGLEAIVERRSETEWQLALNQRSGGRTEQRNVTAPRCEELAEATALLIALSIDPGLDQQRELPVTSAFPEPPPVAPTAPAAAQLPEPRSVSASRVVADVAAPPGNARPLQLRWGASFAGWWRRLPGFAPGGTAHAGVAHDGWLILSELGFFPEQHAEAPDSDAGGDLLMASAGVQAGRELATGRVGLAPLAGAELQWLHGSGAGIDNPRSADVLLVTVLAGARFSVAISESWGFVSSFVLSAPLNRPRFVLDGIGPVHRPDPWASRWGAGVEWRVP